MSTRRVLAISSDLDQLRRLVAALERAGAVVDAVRSPTAIAADAIPHRHVFVSVASASLDDLAALTARLDEAAQVTIVTPHASLAELVACMRDDRVNHVIERDQLDDGVQVTARKLLTGDIFGIEKYLPPGSPVHYERLRDFEGRKQAVQAVLDFAEQAKVRRQVRGAIGQVCEELLMNALYDAPVDQAGHQIFARVDPRERIKAESPRPVSIRYAATEDRFAIAVRDRYGRLAKNTILAYIEKCVRLPDQIDRKTYGAGLGIYLVASAATTFVVNVAFGIATEVVCVFERGAKAPLRTVGVFVHPGGAENLRYGPTPESFEQTLTAIDADEPGRARG